MPNHMELRVFEFLHTGNLAPGNIWRATAQTLAKPDEVGEIVYAEVVSPVAPGGAEDLAIDGRVAGLHGLSPTARQRGARR